MALGQHVLNPGDALPLPLGEVDLRSKDGEGLSFIQQKERFYETIYCHRKRRGVRLSRFVQSVTRDLPTSLLYKSFRNKRVKVKRQKGRTRGSAQGGRPH